MCIIYYQSNLDTYKYNNMFDTAFTIYNLKHL